MGCGALWLNPFPGPPPAAAPRQFRSSELEVCIVQLGPLDTHSYHGECSQTLFSFTDLR